MSKSPFAVVAVVVVFAEVLASGCKDPIPKGPDLVACPCECFTQVPQGAGPGSCNTNQCDPPCGAGRFCTGPGRCESVCSVNIPPVMNPSPVTNGTAFVCVDAKNVSNVTAACSERCDAFGSAQATAVSCVTSLLDELGLKNVVPDAVQKNVSTQIDPNSGAALAGLVAEQCGTLLTDTLTGTCGLATSGVAALEDLFLCTFSVFSLSPNYPSQIRTCTSTTDGLGKNFEVQQVNGCPQFQPQGNDGGAGGAGTPVGGSPIRAPTSSIVATESSLVSISGQDVTAAAVHPSGSVSTGRVGPLFFLTQLDTTLPAGQVTVQGNGVTLSGAFLKLKAPVAGLLTAGPLYTIAAGKLRVIVTGFLNGDITSVEAVNTAPVTGLYDEAAGSFDLSGSLALQGLNATVQLELTFAFVNRPPLANAGPDRTVECTLPTRAGIVPLSAGNSADPDPGDRIADYAWTVAKEMVAHGPNAHDATATVGLGTRVATLTTTDTHGSVSRDAALITVVDTKPPVFPSLPPLFNSLCGPESQPAQIPMPAVTDACGAAITVTGAVISSNGKTLATPVPVQNGQAQLSTGSHVVRWTATDQSGNVATATQTVNVRPAVLASNSIAIEDRAQIRAGSGFATLGNSGMGTVSGVQAQTGSIVSRGDVFLRDRTVVNGNIVTGGTITTQNLTTVTGTKTEHATVSLPPGRDLSGIVFPTTNAGPITLLNGASGAAAPGAYAAVTVNAGSTLTLRTGTYYFASLDLEPQSRLNLDQAAGAVQLYVRTSIIDRGRIATTAGAAGGFLLGYAGTNAFAVESAFPGGTVIAPNAGVTIASLGANAFTGQLFAKDIDVRPDATLSCVAVPGATP